MRGLARIAVVALVATLAIAVAAPPLVAESTKDTVVDAGKKKKKKKKRKFTVECEGTLDHGTGESDVDSRCTVRDKSRRGRPPVKGASVTGALTEPIDSGARASTAPDFTDSARTDAQGVASLTFTIDTYGVKQVTITVKKKGFVTAKKTYAFTVGAEEGAIFP